MLWVSMLEVAGQSHARCGSATCGFQSAGCDCCGFAILFLHQLQQSMQDCAGPSTEPIQHWDCTDKGLKSNVSDEF